MAMVERALDYQEVRSFEERRLRVLNGTAAREKANAHRADVVKIALAVMAVLVYMLAVTFMEGRISSVGLEINSVKARIGEIQNDTLIAELAIGDHSSLSWIEQYAQENLGMVTPTAADIYYLNEESSLIIAQGLQEQAAPLSTMAEEEPPGGFLSTVAAAVGGFFNGKALAAAEE